MTDAVEANSITSVFLDECLHMFFVRFIPTFPVLHRATFVFRDCMHPLLLNAVAIGSLYLGPKDAMGKVSRSHLVMVVHIYRANEGRSRERSYGALRTQRSLLL